MRVPRPLSRFIGRQGVLDELAALVDRHRLLSMIGPGGCGKTRLAMELAARVSADFRDGAVFVPLAPVQDPALIAPTIAERLGLQDSHRRGLVPRLADYFADHQMLVILDNFEHLLHGAGVVTDLLAGDSPSRVIVTSRAPLHLAGEQVFPVPPMALDSDAVALFVARAQAVVPHLVPDPATVRAIVGRLDGLPLAIELAAARAPVLPPDVLLRRLDQSLDVLVGGGPDRPERQQTLRSTIAWSHELLSPDARELFAVCAAFRGGASLADLEATAAGRVGDALSAAQELVDHSLLGTDAGHARLTMLETVREFALALLEQHPQSAQILGAHAEQFAAKVVPLHPAPIWPTNELLDTLATELDNLRAALDWLQQHDPPAGLRMAGRLSAFWAMHGWFDEGRRRLANLLALVPDKTPDRVRALNGAAWLASDQGEAPEELLAESLALARGIKDRTGEGVALLTRGRLTLATGDTDGAAQLLGAARDVFEAEGYRHGVAAASLLLGASSSIFVPIDVALPVLEQCAALCTELGLSNLRARTLQLVGLAHARAGNSVEARTALADGVPTVVASGDRFGIALGLGALITLAVITSRPRLALRLAGARDAFEALHDVTGPAPLRRLTEEVLTPVRSKLGASVADTIQAEGRAMTVGQALDAALVDRIEDAWEGLTRRESEVAGMVATGLTNREIAERLVLSVRTVETHVDRILTKRGFASRGQLISWAHEHGLAGGSEVA